MCALSLRPAVDLAPPATNLRLAEDWASKNTKAPNPAPVQDVQTKIPILGNRKVHKMPGSVRPGRIIAVANGRHNVQFTEYFWNHEHKHQSTTSHHLSHEGSL